MSSDEDVPDDSDNEELPGGDEGGEWIGGEFFSAKRQKRRHQTKEVRVSRESLSASPSWQLIWPHAVVRV
jgi:hypothetical protein